MFHVRSLLPRGFPLLVSFGNAKVGKLRFTRPVLTESALGRPPCPGNWEEVLLKRLLRCYYLDPCQCCGVSVGESVVQGSFDRACQYIILCILELTQPLATANYSLISSYWELFGSIDWNARFVRLHLIVVCNPYTLFTTWGTVTVPDLSMLFTVRC